MLDISEEQFYREMISNDIIESLLSYYSDDENLDRVRWFNEGIRFAAMIARSGYK